MTGQELFEKLAEALTKREEVVRQQILDECARRCPKAVEAAKKHVEEYERKGWPVYESNRETITNGHDSFCRAPRIDEAAKQDLERVLKSFVLATEGPALLGGDVRIQPCWSCGTLMQMREIGGQVEQPNCLVCKIADAVRNIHITVNL